jgi:vitamin B12/bleomycin/antimicrobial peptide transport system ATP-binding/permease protein
MAPPPKPGAASRRLVQAFRRLIRPYWTSPDARWSLVLLALAITLQFSGVYSNVRLAQSQMELGNALGARDLPAFRMGFVSMIFFMLLSVVIPAYADWLQQLIRIRWRRWLTADCVQRWIAPHAYTQEELHRGEIDNPDVRIAEDVRDFVSSSLGLSLSLLSSIVTLASFGMMLWNLSSAWAIPVAGHTLRFPGLMLWISVGFALFSMWLTNRVGRRLIPINFDRIRVEADFRYGMVHYRDNVEAVALLHGEQAERKDAAERFDRVADNFRQLVGAQRNLNILTQGMGQANSLVPLAVAGLAYFGNLVPLGVIPQTRYAYGQVAGGLAWFVNAYQEIARWRANIERLLSFLDVMDTAEREFEHGGITITHEAYDSVRLEDLHVETARGRPVLDGVSAKLAAGDEVALVGRQGSGRSMLVRALAGIWPFGSGQIHQPPRDRIVFLSRRRYLPVGTLRAAVCYPADADAFADEQITQALEAFGLASLLPRLNDVEPWWQTLSPHEQQRLALASVVLQQPKWIVLDDATSDLDEQSEAMVYDALKKRLPGVGLLAVTDKPSLRDRFSRRWTFEPDAAGATLQTT